MQKQAGISNTSVKAKTGKDWHQWIAIIKNASPEPLSHKEIAAYLRKHHDLSPWWSQMVTVGYEQAMGLREKNETTRGFQVSASKTFYRDINYIYKLFSESSKRKRWLSAGYTVKKAVEDKLLRLSWHDSTVVEIQLYSKGTAKTQVTIQHQKLPDSNSVRQMKSFWKSSLAQLNELLSVEKQPAPSSKRRDRTA